MSIRRLLRHFLPRSKSSPGDAFLGSCRDLYRAGFRPFSLDPDTDAYRNHAALAHKLIAQAGLRSFLENLQEGAYYVSYWTALFAREAGSTDPEEILSPAGSGVGAECLRIVARYAEQLPADGPARAAAAGWLEAMRVR